MLLQPRISNRFGLTNLLHSEEMDYGLIEALSATGASRWQIICQAVLASTISALLSRTFIRFEINFTNAIAVGAAASAGGIGFQHFMASAFYHDIHELGAIVYMILIVAILLEVVSLKLRSRYLKQD